MESSPIREVGGKTYEIARILRERRDPDGSFVTRLYEARDADLQDRVVLKEAMALRSDARAQEWLATALHEARLVQRISRQQDLHIARVRDVRTETGRLWLIMDFVEGHSFGELYLRTPVVPARPDKMRVILFLALDVCRVLQALHTRDIAHRDVAPENIIIQGRNAWLIDFGLAAQPCNQLYRDGSEGTLPYCAPEQTPAGPPHTLPGPASDVYGLAAVLYHALTAQLPPSRSANRSLARPAEINPYVPVQLDQAIMGGLAYHPRARLSLGDFQRALYSARDELRAHQVAARPPAPISGSAMPVESSSAETKNAALDGQGSPSESDSLPTPAAVSAPRPLHGEASGRFTPSPAAASLAYSHPLADRYNETAPEAPPLPEPPPRPWSPLFELPTSQEQARARTILWAILGTFLLLVAMAVLFLVLAR